MLRVERSLRMPKRPRLKDAFIAKRRLATMRFDRFRRAIREGGGVQPEAYVGIARVYEDKGQFAEAIVEFKKALAQLSDSEPVIYQMIGAAYEKLEKPKEAVAAYEKYLQLAPNGSYAAAIRSIIDQLKREAAGEQIIP